MLNLLSEITLDVTRVFLPLVILFLVAQYLLLKMSRATAVKIIAGLLIAFAGLVLFLFGVNVGLMPAGRLLGEKLGSFTPAWALIPLGFILGFVATFAEPAVRILSQKIEDATSGYIRKRLILYTVSLGVAFFVALGMAKIIYGIPILYIMIPGYLVALIIMWFSDRTFVSIAFDAGGVATGPMAVTFLMAVAVGIANSMHERDPILDGFGLIALIALAPIIFILILGIIYRLLTTLKSGEG